MINTIFEPFVTTKGEKGTGLGLSLAKRFVELHGGTMWVDSAPGRGSTFAFVIPPLAEASASAVIAQAMETSR